MAEQSGVINDSNLLYRSAGEAAGEAGEEQRDIMVIIIHIVNNRAQPITGRRRCHPK